MKISQLFSGLDLYLTNEERQFVKKHGNVKISSLDEHNHWIAQNLVRKGAYKISNDNNTLIRQINETDNK
jgi:hypothetical protein